MPLHNFYTTFYARHEHAGKDKRQIMANGITRRNDGLYMWRFQYRGRQYCGYEKRQRAAEKALREKRHEVEHAEAEKTSITVNTWFTRWIHVYKRPACKAGTIETYQSIYYIHIAPEIGQRCIEDLRADQLQEVLNRISATSSGAVLNLSYSVITGMFKRAAINGIVSRNPAAALIRPKGKRKRVSIALSDSQKQEFLKRASCSRFYHEYRLALYTGLRVGEILGLSWSDIDFEQNEIKVRHQLRRTRTGLELEAPKSETSFRVVPMVQGAADILRAQRQAQRLQRMKQGARWNPRRGMDDLVFTTRNGKPVSYSAVNADIKKISKGMYDNGIAPAIFTFHSLRHTFATTANNAGMKTKTLQTVLGHSSMKITSDLYIHPIDTFKAEEMQRIASSL